MENKDIETIANVYNSLKSSDDNAFKIEDPALEVENSLVDFLKHRLKKLKQDVEFEDSVKETILSRISEATFPQLITLLEILQKNSNIGVEKVLAPFIASSGEKTLLDSTKEMGRMSKKSEDLFNEVKDKDILQSLTMLSQLMDLQVKKEE